MHSRHLTACTSAHAAPTHPLHAPPHTTSNRRQVLRGHRTALRSTGRFWQLLLRSDVAYSQIVRALDRIDAAR